MSIKSSLTSPNALRKAVIENWGLMGAKKLKVFVIDDNNSVADTLPWSLISAASMCVSL